MKLNESQMRRVMDAITGFCTAAPDPVRIFAIYSAIDDFCRSVGGIADSIGPIPPVGRGVYRVVAPFGGSIYDITGISLWRERVEKHHFVFRVEQDGSAIINIDGSAFPGFRPHGLFVSLKWLPSERTMELPSQWFEKNFDAIRVGAIYEVLSQAGTAWANPLLAERFAGDLSRHVSDAIAELRLADSPGGRLSCFDREATWVPGL